MQYHIISVEVSLVRGAYGTSSLEAKPDPKNPAIVPNCLFEAPWRINPKISRVISGDVYSIPYSVDSAEFHYTVLKTH